MTRRFGPWPLPERRTDPPAPCSAAARAGRRGAVGSRARGLLDLARARPAAELAEPFEQATATLEGDGRAHELDVYVPDTREFRRKGLMGWEVPAG